MEGKAFLLGDKPCNEDAALFGMLCQIVYAERGPTNQYLKSKQIFTKFVFENLLNDILTD